MPQISQKVSEKLQKIKIKDIMTRSVITTQECEPLSDLADILIKSKISGVPVVDDSKKIIGIITTTDFLNFMGKIKEGFDINPKNLPQVKDVMTKGAVTLLESDTLFDAVNVMMSRQIHTLPVVKDDKLIGIVGRRDVIMYFYAALRDSVGEPEE